jgi:hypothetical protein
MLIRIKNKIFREINKLKVIYSRRFYLNKFDFNKVIILLVPNDNQINGGVMSIASIHKELNLLSAIHKCNVIACTNVYDSNEFFLKFDKFDNEMLVFNFKNVLKKLINTNYLQLHIPELYIESFTNSFQNEWSDIDKKTLKNIENLNINILNQNDLLMPDAVNLENLKNILTNNITMTVAHKKYATIDKYKQYNIPLHYLSVWLNPKPYDFKRFLDKKSYIVFSPDELERLNIVYHSSKSDLINQLKKQLPDFEIIVIQKMTYENYKKLISDSKFMITFGEGLDAYFVETILSGGISFAIYNEVFFSEDFKSLPTIYKSVDDLFLNISKDIQYYNHSTRFDEYNKQMKSICEIEYSYEKYQNRVKNFVLENYDFK